MEVERIVVGFPKHGSYSQIFTRLTAPIHTWFMSRSTTFLRGRGDETPAEALAAAGLTSVSRGGNGN
nr:hypothetical protein CFP56_25714 [Quercus suber]